MTIDKKFPNTGTLNDIICHARKDGTNILAITQDWIKYEEKNSYKKCYRLVRDNYLKGKYDS